MNLRDAIERLSNNHGSNDERRQEAVALVYACLEQVSRLLEFELAVRASPVWDWVEGAKSVSRPGSGDAAHGDTAAATPSGFARASSPQLARCQECCGTGVCDSYMAVGGSPPCPTCHGTGAAAEAKKADRVIGCIRCAKPCALVGDKIPTDELCPWCRDKDSPGVAAARDKKAAPEANGPRCLTCNDSRRVASGKPCPDCSAALTPEVQAADEIIQKWLRGELGRGEFVDSLRDVLCPERPPAQHSPECQHIAFGEYNCAADCPVALAAEPQPPAEKGEPVWTVVHGQHELNYAGLRAENDQLRRDLTRAHSDLAQAQLDIAKLGDERDAARAELDEERKAHATEHGLSNDLSRQWAAEVLELKKKLYAAEDALQTSRAELASLQKKLDDETYHLNNECDIKLDRIKDLEFQLRMTKEELAGARDFERYKSRLAEANKKLDATRDALQTSRDLCDELRKACAEKDGRIGELEQTVTRLRELNTGAHSDLSLRMAEVRTLRNAAFTATQRADAAEARVRELETKHATEIETHGKVIDELGVECDELQTKLDAAEAACDSIRTVADEAFGPFPVQSTEEAITAIERGVFEQRTALERARGLAAKWSPAPHHLTRACGRELLAAIDGEGK